MGRRFKIWAASIIVINILGFSSIYIIEGIEKYIAKKIYHKVKNNDKVFVYETYLGSLNSVMYVDDLQDTMKLIKYYNKLAKLDTATAFIDFEIKSMPLTFYKPIYVYKKLNKGSNIVELVDFNKKCWGYMAGYVYKPTTHENPPPDSLIKLKEDFIRKYNNDEKVKILNRISKKISSYGWYCNE